MYVQPLNANLSTRYEAPAVKAFNFAEKSGMLYYITAGDKAEEKPGIVSSEYGNRCEDADKRR